LGEGARVIAPDLIGFGRSDQPKKEGAHSLHFHLQYLEQLLVRLQVRGARLMVAASVKALGDALFALPGPVFLLEMSFRLRLRTWLPVLLKMPRIPTPDTVPQSVLSLPAPLAD